MFHYLRRIVSPTSQKLHFLRNHPWLHVMFFSSTTSSSRSKGNSFTISYLIDTCGFPPERAASVSKYLNLKSSQKPELAFEFFKSLGFSQSQALIVIKGQPQLLLADPEKSLAPKIDFFKSVGFSESDILRIVLRRPHILTRSLKNEIIPNFDFLNNMFESKHQLRKTIVRFSGILLDLDSVLLPNIKLLKRVGVPKSHVTKFIEQYPRTSMIFPKLLEEIVQEVKELGFSPLQMKFAAAIHVKLCIGRTTWARKEDIYRKWGLSDYDISAAFKFHPLCMTISENKIDAAMDFLVNKLGYTSSVIVKCPVVLSMSLEKRVIPRGSVILALKSKGLVDELSLRSVFMCDEMAFLNRFVSSHKEEAEELLKLYHAKMKAVIRDTCYVGSRLQAFKVMNEMK